MKVNLNAGAISCTFLVLKTKPQSCSLCMVYGSNIFIADDPTEDPINLLYVAITRARKQLVMSPTLLRVLKEAKVSLLISTMQLHLYLKIPIM